MEPVTEKQIEKIKKMQWMAAHYILGNYKWLGSIKTMLEDLYLESLASRQKVSYFKFLSLLMSHRLHIETGNIFPVRTGQQLADTHNKVINPIMCHTSAFQYLTFLPINWGVEQASNKSCNAKGC